LNWSRQEKEEGDSEKETKREGERERKG